jgi:hypothetical protein
MASAVVHGGVHVVVAFFIKAEAMQAFAIAHTPICNDSHCIASLCIAPHYIASLCSYIVITPWIIIALFVGSVLQSMEVVLKRMQAETDKRSRELGEWSMACEWSM